MQSEDDVEGRSIGAAYVATLSPSELRAGADALKAMRKNLDTSAILKNLNVTSVAFKGIDTSAILKNLDVTSVAFKGIDTSAILKNLDVTSVAFMGIDTSAILKNLDVTSVAFKGLDTSAIVKNLDTTSVMFKGLDTSAMFRNLDVTSLMFKGLDPTSLLNAADIVSALGRSLQDSGVFSDLAFADEILSEVGGWPEAIDGANGIECRSLSTEQRQVLWVFASWLGLYYAYVRITNPELAELLDDFLAGLGLTVFVVKGIERLFRD